MALALGEVMILIFEFTFKREVEGGILTAAGLPLLRQSPWTVRSPEVTSEKLVHPQISFRTMTNLFPSTHSQDEGSGSIGILGVIPRSLQSRRTLNAIGGIGEMAQ
jgi:hypothetical protein